MNNINNLIILLFFCIKMLYETKDNFESELNKSVCETSSVVDVDALRNAYASSVVSSVNNVYNKKNNSSRHCELCNSYGEDGSFIILSCNHSFHINCIANGDHVQAKKCHILDDDFFINRKCYICETQMDSSEIIYVHSKFSKTSVNLISAHDLEINKLERQINKLKDELKTAIEYKQKLEFDKEKSKQILVMLNLSL